MGGKRKRIVCSIVLQPAQRLLPTSASELCDFANWFSFDVELQGHGLLARRCPLPDLIRSLVCAQRVQGGPIPAHEIADLVRQWMIVADGVYDLPWEDFVYLGATRDESAARFAELWLAAGCGAL